MGAEAKSVTPDTAAAIAEWCGGVLVEEIDSLDSSVRRPGINVPCGDQVKRASCGNTVIRKHDGTFDVVR